MSNEAKLMPYNGKMTIHSPSLEWKEIININ